VNSTQAASGPSHTEIGNFPQPRLWNEAGAGDKAGDASDSDDLQRAGNLHWWPGSAWSRKPATNNYSIGPTRQVSLSRRCWPMTEVVSQTSQSALHRVGDYASSMNSEVDSRVLLG